MKQLKQKTLIILFMLLLFIGAYSKTYAMEPQFDQLLQLTHEMQQQPFKITNWSLYSRTIRSIPDLAMYQQQVSRLKLAHENFNWSKESEKGQYVSYIGTHFVKNLGIKETIRFMLYPQKNTYKAYLIYSVKGTVWNNQIWKEFSPTAHKRMSQLFKQSPQLFSCISGEESDKMDIILSKKANDILKDFSAKKVEQLKEKTFVSLSAYTNVWNQSIQTNDHKMNLQVALRHVGHTITLTIGTPIITTEY